MFKAKFECDRCDFSCEAAVGGLYEWRVFLPEGTQLYHFGSKTYQFCKRCVEEIESTIQSKLSRDEGKKTSRNKTEVA